MHSGSVKPARPIWEGLALKENHAQDEGGCTLGALGRRRRLVAQEGDTSDGPWACVQLHPQLLHGSGPAPSTSLLEICYSWSMWTINDLPTPLGREG